MLTARETKDALIERLLESPLAAELERSLNSGAEAVRRRAAEDLEARKRKDDAELAPLIERATATKAKRDQLRKELELAEREAREAGHAAVLRHEAALRAQHELRQLSTASAERLRELGLI